MAFVILGPHLCEKSNFNPQNDNASKSRPLIIHYFHFRARICHFVLQFGRKVDRLAERRSLVVGSFQREGGGRFMKMLVRVFALAAVLAMEPISALKAQTTTCSMDLQGHGGCFLWNLGSCDIPCACLWGLPYQNNNAINVYSCSTGFVACCACCQMA